MNMIKICGIGIQTIFDAVFRYLPFFLTVLGTPQCPPRLRTAKRYVTCLVSNHDRRIMSENPGVICCKEVCAKKYQLHVIRLPSRQNTTAGYLPIKFSRGNIDVRANFTCTQSIFLKLFSFFLSFFIFRLLKSDGTVLFSVFIYKELIMGS